MSTESQLNSHDTQEQKTDLNCYQTAADFFHLDPEFEMVNITSFLQDCKLAKEKFHKNLGLASYSEQPATLDNMVNAEIHNSRTRFERSNL